MRSQSVSKQVAIGASFGVIGALTDVLKSPEKYTDVAYMLGFIVGGAFLGSMLYMVAYKFWPK